METVGEWVWLADNIKIAEEYTVGYWKGLRDKLPVDENPDNQDWDEALKIFETRVNTRFINPIVEISKMDPDAGKGEGFSVVALQCILIEFFEAFYEGRTFILKRGTLNADESRTKYNRSDEMFKNFLTEHEPFSAFFCTHDKNNGDLSCNLISYYTFYNNFRCGLLHEAATKGSSIIRIEKNDKDGNPLDPEHKILIEKCGNKIILYRTPFQKALEQYLKNYKSELMSSGDRKEKFKNKMDELCQIPNP